MEEGLVPRLFRAPGPLATSGVRRRLADEGGGSFPLLEPAELPPPDLLRRALVAEREDPARPAEGVRDLIQEAYHAPVRGMGEAVYGDGADVETSDAGAESAHELLLREDVGERRAQVGDADQVA